MDSKSIRFAFAVNQQNAFEPQNFGNADKFLIYEWNNNEFLFLKEETNYFKKLDEDQNGSVRKGTAIVDLLKSLDIKVLVSIKFGKNVEMVNRNFIPVIVFRETPDDVVLQLRKHIKWIEDELRNRPEEFKLFTIKNGIMKTSLKKSSFFPSIN